MNQLIKKLYGNALDVAVPYTWSSLEYAEVRNVVEAFSNLIAEEFLAIAENELHPQAYAQVLTKVQQHFYETAQT